MIYGAVIAVLGFLLMAACRRVGRFREEARKHNKLPKESNWPVPEKKEKDQ